MLSTIVCSIKEHPSTIGLDVSHVVLIDGPIRHASRTQARAAAATKFIVFSRPRSASTTFVSALNSHPNVSCGYEVFAQHNFAADGLREV